MHPPSRDFLEGEFVGLRQLSGPARLVSMAGLKQSLRIAMLVTGAVRGTPPRPSGRCSGRGPGVPASRLPEVPLRDVDCTGNAFAPAPRAE